ncbi:MAG: FAD-dependent oxidoreductase [Clostridiales bacterium]|nr:FAD-dependent oxidoreductase [Candidatus Cacconaster stercorequi]
MTYDVLIIGGGPGGIYSAYELLEKRPDLRIAMFESGHTLAKRRCPIDGDKVKSCIKCPTCAIMNGFGGAGAFSDGKYNITNQFGGTLHEYIGKKQALELMDYVDEINMKNGGEGTHLYSTGATPIKKLCLENDLHLLDASVRHLGTDINYVVLENLLNHLQGKMDLYFDTPVKRVEKIDGGYRVVTEKESYDGTYCVISVGRSGSKWMETVCRELDINTHSNRVDIGVRVELPHQVFAHLTDELYESKIVYRTKRYQDKVRTFCMNPHGVVVNENTNGIVTVNGHSYEDPALHTENTNFALLVSKHFSEPFKDSNGYGESIARLSNMLGGGVIVQRFGDLIRGQRSTAKRLGESFVTPTLAATPGDLSLVMPKRILDGIIEMIYALDKIAPGTANDDTLLYGVEVKFYNMEVELTENLETCHPGLFVIGDGSGVTHSLSHASASGVYVARHIAAIAK